MRAAYIEEHGGPEVVRVGETTDPIPAADEVVVEVRAAALNHLDIWICKGRPGLELRMPHVIGSDASGVVLEIGSEVRTVRKGESVLLNPGLNCGVCEFCLRGQQSECIAFGIVGMSCPGTFAERVAVPAVNVYPKPEHLSYEAAAALPLAHVTAWRMLVTRARLVAGETVLIHGIGGGVALAGLQLAKLMGAHVIVTSSSDEKLARARSLGADHGINYATNPDVAAAVRDLTGGRGVDVAFDSVGAETWAINFGAVRRGGRIVHCGVTSGAVAEANISALYWNQISVLGSTMGSQDDFRQMIGAVAAARMDPVLDGVAPLENASGALTRMLEGEQFGKIVLRQTQ